MAVAKRWGRGKPAEIEQRKVRGLEWGPQVEYTTFLASPVYIGQAWGREKHEKGSQRARGLSLSLSFPCTRALSHSLLLASLGPKGPGVSLSLSPRHWGALPTLFSSRLWVGMPSHLEDGFSCYFLNKIELWHRAVTLICLRAITRSVQDPRAVMHQGL